MSALGAGIPVGLPDEATLARLAGEFLAALPNGAPSPALTRPEAAPSVDAGTLALAGRAPALLPQASAGNGVPDRVSDASPAAGRASGVSRGVPEAYAASLPKVGALSAPQPAPLPTSPESGFYFLGGGYPTALDSGREDRVSARSFGLPGEADLAELLSLTRRPDPVREAGGYYFVEPVAGGATNGYTPFDVQAVRRDFPILQERVHGKPLIWFDNAATTHKPQAVIDRLAYFYAHENSNIHRAAHDLAARATDAYEAARDKVAKFIGAGASSEIIFVRGATEAINLVAKTWGVQNIGAGDEIVVSQLEHHANIVPWQQLAAQTGAKIRVIPVDDDGQILLDAYGSLLGERTKLVAIAQVSNALGTVTPVREIIAMAHRVGAKVLVDGAQSISHLKVDVRSLDADFFIFSGHKIYGPTGIGVVYGKAEILDAMPPWQGGGNMIADVTFERTLYQKAPNRFEAGTGNIADAVGLGAALDYVSRIGIEAIGRYEEALLGYATQALRAISGVRIIGTASEKASVLSFVLAGHTTEEVGRALNEEGIAVRSGHHCAQPILRRFGLETTVRPSLAFYNTCAEVDALVAVVKRLAARR
ncbi:family 2A encapsulin nanocompartment cargo protein cysteine desulfurase [Niveibacterium terrae]|uniref:family 2A encapsulin nanocompartment cargo protein cysteine desulfurase n=1 Tax=Niveibacterium terrae TaxID=3373598 RepID=UPI003A902F81